MMNAKTVFLLLICVFALNISAFAQNAGLVIDLNAVFRRYSLVKIDSRAELANVRAGRGIILTLDGRLLRLNVEENDLRSADYRSLNKTVNGEVEVPRTENTTYKGRVSGDDSSIVRLALDGTKVEGFIATGSKELYIEPAKIYSSSAAADDFVVYEGKDVINRRGISCPLLSRVEKGMEMVKAKFDGRSFNRKPFNRLFTGTFSQSLTRNMAPGDRILNLSTESDREYVKIFGGSAGHVNQHAANQSKANIRETLNVVEGLYESAVDVTFTLKLQTAWLVADPYADGCDTARNQSDCVLNNFRVYWNTNRPPATYDGRNAALLFTGISTLRLANYAYIGVICNNPDYAYGMLVGDYPASTNGIYRYAAAGHEMAHLFNADHIGGVDLMNNPDCYNSIMGPEDANHPNYGVLRMCQFTINVITTHITNNNCLAIE